MINYDELWWIGLLSFVYRSDSELDISQGPTAWVVLPKIYDVIRNRQFEVRNQNSKQDARTLLYTRSCFMIFIEGQATLVACSALQHRIRNSGLDEQWRTPLVWHMGSCYNLQDAHMRPVVNKILCYGFLQAEAHCWLVFFGHDWLM